MLSLPRFPQSNKFVMSKWMLYVWQHIPRLNKTEPKNTNLITQKHLTTGNKSHAHALHLIPFLEFSRMLRYGPSNYAKVVLRVLNDKYRIPCGKSKGTYFYTMHMPPTILILYKVFTAIKILHLGKMETRQFPSFQIVRTQQSKLQQFEE